jgi:hypothetical protein
MSDPDPAPAPKPRHRQGFWLTVGEIVGVLALIIAGLNFWDSHQQREVDAKREQAQSQAASAFVLTGEADGQGRAIALRPLKASQAIQSQRYRFPMDLVDHPVDLTAERPRIEVDWISGGLRRTLDLVHARPNGEARSPVVVETTYVEDGDTRTDISLYQIGFAWKREFLGGRQIRLTGIALSRRGLTGDSSATVEQRWTTARADLGAR